MEATNQSTLPAAAVIAVKRNLFTEESNTVEVNQQNNMATLTQPVLSNTSFSPIKTTMGDTDIINQCVTMAKISKPPSSPTSAKPTETSTNESPKMNGTLSPKPYTTSQNKPPKIKLLNRSANVASPVADLNGIEDNNTQDIQEGETLKEKEEAVAVIEPSLETPEDIVKVQQIKIQPDVTSQTLHRPPQQQTQTQQQAYNVEYSSSPSSTTSSLNRENSLDYKDSTGVDLHDFMVKTLKENPRDRLMLLKLERDFTEFIEDKNKTGYKYNQMTSYHRMLVHRVAAYFGLDHNIDNTGKAVVISKTPSSRVPETKFQAYCSREYTDEEISSPKVILPRSASTDEPGAGTPTNSFDSEVVAYSPKHTARSTDSSVLSEKEAAIAVVAARTGGKPGSTPSVTTKRVKPFELQLQGHQGQVHQWDNNVSTPSEAYAYPTEGSSGGSTNPYIANQAILRGPNQPDGSGHVYFNPNYSAQVAYVPGAAGYVAPQPSPQQGNPYAAVYAAYVPGSTGTQASPIVASPGQVPNAQYYMHPSGSIVCVPRQAGNVSDGNVQFMTQQQHQQQQVQQHYQDVANQMNAMNIDNQNSNTRTDNASQQQTQQQLISPTSPSTPTEHPTPAQQQRKIVYVPSPSDQIQQSATAAAAQYTNYPAGYPVQYYQNVVPNYPGYQDTTQVAAATAAVPSNMAQHVTTPQHGALMYQRGGNSFYVPVTAAGGAQAQQQMMLVSGGAGQIINGQKWTDFYTRNNKFSNMDNSTTNEYRKVDASYQQGYAIQQPAHQQNISMAQRPLMQIPANYQQYAYMQGPPKRFMHNQVLGQHFVRPNIPTQKKYRPHHRVSAGNEQIRISRPNSQPSDSSEQNTVGHILEIYDFPDAAVSDQDTIFDAVRNYSSGARILKINSSSSQTSHNSNQVKPTILAIFKSASEAQKALESVKSPYYKLRVSKKSPTHLSTSDYSGHSSKTKPT